jgi:hypothetical protein
VSYFQEDTRPKKKNRQADEKTLERKPLNGELQTHQHDENIAFQAPTLLAHPLQ